MVGFEVRVEDSASPRIKAIEGAYARGAHRTVMAASGANVVKDHFVKRDRQKHRGKSNFHFYATAAKATSHEVRGNHALVRIDHVGIGLRRFGGTVRPRVSKFLTIPVADEAHGRRVREFGSDVQFIVNRRSGKGVVTLGGRVLYALTKKTVHGADPSVLPTDREIADQVIDDLRVFNENLGGGHG